MSGGLDAIFNPRCIAVIGASNNPLGLGGPVFRNLGRSGFSGPVYPVNPKYQEVQGAPAFPNVAQLPRVPDLAVICTPASTVPALVRQCGECGVRGLIILSAGFREAGEAGRVLERQVDEELQRHPGMRAVGPNCLGVIAPTLGLNASFAGSIPRAGHLAFLSQSGALCTAVLDWAEAEGIGFSAFVSVGNMVDVGFGDLLDYFGEDPATEAILLYIESISDAEAFLAAARKVARNKPVVAYKAGRFSASAKAAASHTGAMAGEDVVYDAAFRSAGIQRVKNFEDLLGCAELFGRPVPPCGPRLGIVTNAGGPGVMAADALLAGGGELATLSGDTLRRLAATLPSCWSHGNPVDVLGDAPPARLAQAVQDVLRDPGVDAVLVLCTPQAMTEAAAAAEAVSTLARPCGKPVLASWMGGRQMHEGIRTLRNAGIPTYSTPEQAIRAFEHLVRYSRCRQLGPFQVAVTASWLSILRPELRDLLQRFGPASAGAAEPSGTSSQSRVLSEVASQAVLERCGIPVVRTEVAATADAAVECARRIGFPVALKVLSPDITHKTEAGGVVLDLRDEVAVRGAFSEIHRRAREHAPAAPVTGVAVQRMVAAKDGLELIVGARRDPVFGAVVMVGMGGVAAELMQDRAVELAPITEERALAMLQSLRLWPLLNGYRNRPVVDLRGLTDVLVRVSHLAADAGEIQELDINPLLISPEGAIALDARIVLTDG